jgi:hypothetical protein
LEHGKEHPPLAWQKELGVLAAMSRKVIAEKPKMKLINATIKLTLRMTGCSDKRFQTYSWLFNAIELAWLSRSITTGTEIVSV